MKSKNPFNHAVTIQLQESNKHLLDWLVKEHGAGGIRKASRWTLKESNQREEDRDALVVAFREPQHATAFALKWA
jgi:hypothetical protein